MDRPTLTHDAHSAVEARVRGGAVRGEHASCSPTECLWGGEEALTGGGGRDGSTPIAIALHLHGDSATRRPVRLPAFAQAALVAVEAQTLIFHVSPEVRDFPGCIDELVRTVEATLLVRVLRVGENDLVGVGEIARRTGRTRESIRLLVEGRRRAGGFPRPEVVIDRRVRVWQWDAVATWLDTQGVISDNSVQRGGDERGRFLTAYNALLRAREPDGSLPPRSARALGDAIRRLSA